MQHDHKSLPLSLYSYLIRCVRLFGSVSSSAYSRRLIHEYELYYRDMRGRIIPDAFKFNVIVTTYEVMLCKCVCVWRGGEGEGGAQQGS